MPVISTTWDPITTLSPRLVVPDIRWIVAGQSNRIDVDPDELAFYWQSVDPTIRFLKRIASRPSVKAAEEAELAEAETQLKAASD